MSLISWMVRCISLEVDGAIVDECAWLGMDFHRVSVGQRTGFRASRDQGALPTPTLASREPTAMSVSSQSRRTAGIHNIFKTSAVRLLHSPLSLPRSLLLSQSLLANSELPSYLVI